MPRGGRRPGAGRKPKPKPFGTVLQHPSAPVAPPSTNYPLPPVEEFDAPDSLTDPERKVWLEQSPHAFKNRTLTRSTAAAFERYCRVVVLERAEGVGSSASGPNHRGLLKQINQYELQFLLCPNGRPMVDAVPVAAQTAAVSGLSKFRS